MVVSGDLSIIMEHPLASELSSLRVAVARFQDEAYSSSLKLQRHALDTANAHDRIAQLERENELLKSELAILRATPHPDASPQAHPAIQQVQQLTLSLRKLSDKLSLTEEVLLERTTQLAEAKGEAAQARLVADSAYELAARTRGREEAGKARELDLEWKVKAAQEAAKMSDLVVSEYADFVRALEAKAGMRPSIHSRSTSSSSSLPGAADTNSASSLADNLSAGKLGMQRLLAEFSAATEKLQAETVKLDWELATSESKREADRKSFENSMVELAKAQFELQQLKLDDKAAAKMVSRYMKFSQKSTDLLQDAMTTLKARHEATITTLNAQLSQLSSQLHFTQSQTEKLRDALDELGGEIMKETYGRRREVALRIRMLNREEKLRADLERWVLRAEETLAREPDNARAVHEAMIRGARSFLTVALGGVSSSSSGSLARLIVAQHAVDSLTAELEFETARRFELARLVTLQNSGTFEGRDLPIDNPLPDPPAQQPPVLSHGTLAAEALQLLSTSPEITQLGGAHTPNEGPELLSEGPADMVADVPLSNINESIEGDQFPSEEHTVSVPSRDTALTANQRSLPPSPKPAGPEVDTHAPPTFLGLSINSEVPHALNGAGEQEVQLGADPHPVIPWITPTPYVDLRRGEAPQSPAAKRAKVGETTEQETRHPFRLDQHDHLPLSQADSNADQSLEVFSSLEHAFRSSEGATSGRSSLASPPRIPVASATYTSIDYSVSDVDVSQHNIHPLLAELRKTRHRYDDLQRAFRDCHIALEALTKNVLSSVGPNASSASHVPNEVLHVALQRLNDYTEDAHVELEICIADEALVARGFKTLLSVPGAISSPSTSSLSSAQSDSSLYAHDVIPSRPEVETQVKAFILGTDSNVEKARINFSRKLEDIQHDIAALKLVIHDGIVPSSPPQTAPVTNGNFRSGGGWTSWIRSSPSTPSSATAGMGPAPTFGNVMTTPRLRHSPSLNFPIHSGQRTLTEATNDPLASLGLKVPMPGYVHHTPQIPQRSRTVSTMYMLGLGATRPSGTFPSPSPKKTVPPPRLRLQDAETDTEEDTDIDEEVE